MKKKFLLFQVKQLAVVFLISLFHSPEAGAESEYQEQLQVNGTVTSAGDNAPLPGVSVVVKGTTAGTTTDANGNYSVNVPDGNSTLIFSFIGYKTIELPINTRTVIDVVLESDIQELSEVVVIGYGTQKKADLTGAVAIMNTDQLNERPLARVDQALVGQMAGVRVAQTSGISGEGFRVQIRGTGSINANNEPLYVIDGFPLELSPQNASGDFATGSPLDNLNPNDIESIQVLKDASAAAIYGSRASNGVVIITTKKGKSGKPTITFNAYGGTTRESKRVDFLNAEEWIDLASDVINFNYMRDHATYGGAVGDNQAARFGIINQRRTDLGQAPLADGTINTSYMLDDRWDPSHPQHNELLYVDWQDEIFRTGVVQNYNIAANGGNDNLSYYVSGDVLDQVGHIVGVDYKRYSARANVEVTASDRVKFGVNIAPSYSLRNDGGAEGKDQQMHLTGTILPVVEREVGLDANVFPNGFYPWGNSRVSPPRVLEESLGEIKTFRNLSSAYVNVNIAEGLDIKSTVNLDHAEVKVKNFMPSIVSRNRATTGRLRGNTRQTFVNENFLSYNRTLATDHNISAILGTSYSTTKFDNWDMRGTFAGDDVTTLNAATINPDQVTAEETRNVLVSFFGRAQYNYADRYLLSASIRRDGSSRFGVDTKWGVFPSLSVGWRVTNESFFNVPVLSDLKVRAAWGVSGNQGGIDDYGHIALLDVSNYSFGGNILSGQIPTNIPNRNLSWEESETINIGADIGLLQDRIYLSADYYRKVNSNLLMDVTIPSAAGFTTVLTNIGKVENRGWELELSTQNMTGPLQWTTSLNLSHNQNEVLALGPENADILGGSEDINHNILRVGEPMYTLYLVQQDGILSQADIDAGAALLGAQTAGNPRYVDQPTDTDGDGVMEEPNGTIGPEDRVLSGQPLPSHTWGITNNFRYKGFDLSVLVQGQWGGHIYSLYGRGVDRTDMGYNENRLGLWRDRWRSEEDPGAGLRGKPYSTGPRIKNTDWLYPSDYVRVRNITLGYDLGSMIRVNGISGLRLYMTLENYFGSDKYDGGWNPEAVTHNGDDYGAAPIPKSMIFGLNLKL
jgi:TonB-dependent starch-binding outer membrane protein SusC